MFFDSGGADWGAEAASAGGSREGAEGGGGQTEEFDGGTRRQDEAVTAKKQTAAHGKMFTSIIYCSVVDPDSVKMGPDPQHWLIA